MLNYGVTQATLLSLIFLSFSEIKDIHDHVNCPKLTETKAPRSTRDPLKTRGHQT